jgi:transcriptional regulator of arginine metabolism
MCLAAAGASLVLVQSRTASMAYMAAAVSAASFAFVALGWWRPDLRPAAGAAPVFSTLLVGLLAAAAFGVVINVFSAILVILSASSAGLGDRGPLARWPTWASTLACAALTVALAAVAVWFTRGSSTSSPIDIFMHLVNTYALQKPRRQSRIVSHLRKGSVASQERLVELLKGDGIEVTQATLSRDLHDLGVVKGPAGYMLPGQSQPAPHNGDLERAVRSMLLSAQAGGNLAVLHTGPGQAPALALEIDRAGLKAVLGTVAGDDTIFIAARSSREAGKLLHQLQAMAGIG